MRRRPQNARPDTPDVVQVYPLRRTTRAALQRWFLVRRLLMTEVTGGADWLWVSVRGNHGSVVAEGAEPEYRPAGTALQPRGVARSYTATVAKVNVDLAGSDQGGGVQVDRSAVSHITVPIRVQVLILPPLGGLFAVALLGKFTVAPQQWRNWTQSTEE